MKASKNAAVELFLCIFLGYFGVHHFYAGNKKKGLIYLFTFGLFGLGWLFDIIMLAARKRCNTQISEPAPVSVTPPEGYYLAYQYSDVKFYPPVEITSKANKNYLKPGAEIQLRQEPQNAYDNRAVALYVSGQKIGYLRKGTLQDMANDYIKNGWPIKCILSSLTFSNGEYEGYVHLFYYRKSTKARQ